jgi:hypothetical protein
MSQPQPEARWIVTLDESRIVVSDPDGASRDIAKADLAGIVIETNDSGPWGGDFWWLLLRADKDLLCAFPQGATGEKEAMDWMLALPGFDHEAMIRASGTTEKAYFPVWQRN